MARFLCKCGAFKMDQPWQSAKEHVWVCPACRTNKKPPLLPQIRVKVLTFTTRIVRVVINR